ncbi:uncharacterized [Tachysurus ichikawai]
MLMRLWIAGFEKLLLSSLRPEFTPWAAYTADSLHQSIQIPGIFFIQVQPAKWLKNVVVGTKAGFRLWISAPLEEELRG